MLNNIKYQVICFYSILFLLSIKKQKKINIEKIIYFDFFLFNTNLIICNKKINNLNFKNKLLSIKSQKNKHHHDISVECYINYSTNIPPKLKRRQRGEYLLVMGSLKIQSERSIIVVVKNLWPFIAFWLWPFISQQQLGPKKEGKRTEKLVTLLPQSTSRHEAFSFKANLQIRTRAFQHLQALPHATIQVSVR